jgi:hypothetical protein
VLIKPVRVRCPLHTSGANVCPLSNCDRVLCCRRMLNCRCPGDSALQTRSGCFDSGPAYLVGNGLDRRSPQGLSGGAVRSQPSPPVCLFLVGSDQPLHFGPIAAATARSTRLTNVIDTPLHAYHRYPMFCTASNSNGNRSSKGYQGLAQSSGLHASCLPDYPQLRNVAPSEARTDGPSKAIIQRSYLGQQISLCFQTSRVHMNGKIVGG